MSGDGLDLLRDLMAPLSGSTPRTRGEEARDTQRSKVYKAERATDWSDKASKLLTEKETADLALRIAQYADKLVGRRPRTHLNVEVNPGHGGAMCYVGLNLIRFTTPSTKRWVICHEVAHLIAYRDIRRAFGWSDEQGDNRAHGREFCALYLRLVSHWCSEADAKALRAQFKVTGARSAAKRVMSPEQKAAAVARLAATRPAMTASKVTYRIRVDIPERIKTRSCSKTADGETLTGQYSETFRATWGWYTGRRKDSLGTLGSIRYEWDNGEIDERDSYRSLYEVTGTVDLALTRRTRASIEKALREAPAWAGWTYTIEEIPDEEDQ